MQQGGDSFSPVDACSGEVISTMGVGLFSRRPKFLATPLDLDQTIHEHRATRTFDNSLSNFPNDQPYASISTVSFGDVHVQSVSLTATTAEFLASYGFFLLFFSLLSIFLSLSLDFFSFLLTVFPCFYLIFYGLT